MTNFFNYDPTPIPAIKQKYIDEHNPYLIRCAGCHDHPMRDLGGFMPIDNKIVICLRCKHKIAGIRHIWEKYNVGEQL
jgi:hypothetical protein